MLPPGPLLTHLVTPPVGFALLESTLTTAQVVALESTVLALGAAYAERLMRRGTVVASDREGLGACYVVALRSEDVLPPGIFAVISARWHAAPAAMLQEDVRVQRFVDGFASCYSVRRAAATRASFGQR